MKILKSLLLISLMSTCVYSSAADKILIFSKTAGWKHKSIPQGILAITEIAKAHQVQVDATKDAESFNQANLEQYAAVVFLSTTGDVLNEQQQKAFEKYIQGGGGFAGVHSATDTEYDWPWYNGLVGAYFETHPSKPSVRKGKAIVINQQHPSTVDLPKVWVRNEEWHEFRDFNTDVTVLINIDETTYKKPNEKPLSEPRPIAWFHNYDGGKAFFTAMGHPKESYAEPLFRKHLWGGISSVMRPTK